MKPSLLVASFVLGFATISQAGIVRPGFNTGSMGRNDDSSSAPRELGFSNGINFGGNTYSKLFVNNNGNVTFGCALSTFTPFGLDSLNRAIIAPFFADVDTRNAASGIAAYGTGTVNGNEAFGVTWQDVGYYDSHADKLNSFQLVLINRPDTGSGNFDIEFNYDKILWESGDATRTANALGGTSAGFGFTDASGLSAFELAGSGVAGAFLDSSLTGLIYGSNVGTAGRYVFEVRSGGVSAFASPAPSLTAIPEPATVGFGLALLGFCAMSRRHTVQS
jgi:hypothetical protein